VGAHIEGRMRPAASSTNARNTMRANKATSRREADFRRALYAVGVRGYRIHPRIEGRPDLYFPRLKLAVFIHGCFWHSCTSCNLPVPVANHEFWVAKFNANRSRDSEVIRALSSVGIESLVVWEHEIRRDPDAAASDLASAISQRRAATPARPSVKSPTAYQITGL
jgi:DNA mismatch endonuclease (patch repair protein)